MKRKRSPWKLTALAVLFSPVLFAQIPQFQWANSVNELAGENENAESYSCAVDPSGNVYQAGNFDGTMDFDPGAGNVSMTGGTNAVFIRKLDPAGNLLWVKQIGLSSQIHALGIAADDYGVYTTGYFYGTVNFNPGGTHNLTAAGSMDLFISMLDADGLYKGSFRSGGVGDDRGNSIAARNGLLYVIGSFSSSFDANPTTLGVANVASHGGTDIWILRVGGTGTFSWVRTFGSTNSEPSSAGNYGKERLGIAVNQATGDVYATGVHAGAMDLDPTSGINNVPTGGAFLLKLTSAGAYSWGNILTASASMAAQGVSVDAAGNVYQCGTFSGTSNFNPAGTYNMSSSNQDFFIRKLDASGAFVWAQHYGNASSVEESYAIAASPQGNVFVTGRFYGTVDFDPSGNTANLVSAGGSTDAFYASYSGVDGSYLWAGRAGTTDMDEPYDICVDYAGAMYASGRFRGYGNYNTNGGTWMLPADNTTTTSVFFRAYLLKIEPVCTGTVTNPGFEWAKQMVQSGIAYGQAVRTDADGNVYSTGEFTGTVDFDPGAGVTSLASFGGKDIYLMKQDATGNLLWVQQFKGRGDDYSYSLSIDDSGNVAIGGKFNYDLLFSPVPSLYYTTNGSDDIVVAKFDPSGNLLWSHQFGGTASDYCNAVAFDAAGNLGCTGGFGATVNFDPVGTANKTSLGQTDMYLQKLDASGNLIYITQEGGTSTEYGQSLCFDAAGFAYVTGSFSGTTDFNYSSTPAVTLTAAGGYDGFVGRFRTNGTCFWAKAISGTSTDRGVAIAYDPLYNFVYVTGVFDGTASFNGTSVTSPGTAVGFVWKLSPNAINAWVKTFGAVSAYVYFQAIATDACGDVCVAGHFLNTVDFDPGPGVHTHSPSGGAADVCAFKLTKNGSYCWSKSMGGNSTDNCYGLDVDDSDAVYLTGYFLGSSDYNPGAGTYTLTCPSGSASIFVEKLNPAFPVRMENPETAIENTNANGMTVFPNPSEGLFTLQFNNSTTGNVEVFDISGKSVQSVSFEEAQQQQIDLRGFAKGIYFIRVSGETVNETQRVIVQ